MFKRESKNESKKRFNDIIRKISENTEKGMNEFYDTYSKYIISVARNFCSSQQDAEAIMNSVLVRVWRTIQIKKPKVEHPFSWLYVVTMNCARDFLKDTQTVPLNESITATEDPFAELLEEDAFNTLLKCLSEDERTIIIKRFVAKCSFNEIAEEENKPLSTTTTIYYRGMEKIKEYLEKKKKFE